MAEEGGIHPDTIWIWSVMLGKATNKAALKFSTKVERQESAPCCLCAERNAKSESTDVDNGMCADAEDGSAHGALEATGLTSC